jgi:hypothetical protein
MKKEIIVIVTLIIIIFGATFIILNYSDSDNNNNNNTNNVTLYLNSVALTLDDIDENYILIDEKHWLEPGEFTNSTGNGLIWNYIEHYQSQFIENNSKGVISASDPVNKLLQTITKLESKEKADLYVDLWIDGRQKKGYLNLPIEPIGNKSAYFYDNVSYRDYNIDRYLICFSFEDIVVVIYSDGLNLNQSKYLDYAKIIENNILDSV